MARRANIEARGPLGVTPLMVCLRIQQTFKSCVIL
jgi:hypothetical protein